MNTTVKAKTWTGLAMAFVVTLALSSSVNAKTVPNYGYEPTDDGHIGGKEYSPCLSVGYPQKVYWGDTHLHTSYSTDAGMIAEKNPDLLRTEFGKKISNLVYDGKTMEAYTLWGAGLNAGKDPLAVRTKMGDR